MSKKDKIHYTLLMSKYIENNFSCKGNKRPPSPILKNPSPNLQGQYRAPAKAPQAIDHTLKNHI